MLDDMSTPLLLDEEDTVDVAHAASRSSTVAILGSGDFSRSLAMRLVACGFGVVVGSRCVRRISPGLFLDAVELNSQVAAVAKAKRLVFMALFPEYYPSLLGLRTALAGKILVDVSNAVELNSKRQSNAEELAEMFPDSVIVKGFNTISAWTLQTGAQDGNRQVLLCSDSAEAKCEVAQLARRMGFCPVDAGSLCCAQHLERKPLHLFPSWHGPVLTTFLLFFFFYGYGFIREILLPYLANGQNSFYQLVFDLVNKSLSCVALVSLALVYLPGLFAAWLQLWRGTKYQRFPCWLDAWLLRRKQLGLLSFLFAALHVVHILCLPLRSITQRKLINTAYSQVKSGVEMPWDEQAVWRTDLYLSGGVLGMGMLCLLAITSLPSVSNILTWKEFTFIQSGLGHVALTLTVMHTLVIGWNFAFSFKAYPFFMPPSYMLAVALPCAVLVCRCFLLLPCISARLTRIRRGWESTRKCPVQQHKRLQENRTIPQLNSQVAAVAKAKRLVFMALFPEYYPSLLGLRTALAGKILVDVSNAVELNSKRQSNAEELAEMFPDSVIVKGFNTISAWTLQTGAQDGNRQVLLCSDSAEAKCEVAQLARRMGFCPVDAGSLCCAQHLERKPLHLFPSWHGPVLTTFLLFFFFYGYGFIREILLPYLANGQNSFYQLVFDLVNKSLSCVALVSLALVYLPGLFAAWLQLWRGTKYQRFPCWLDAWLLRRKQLGLLSFLFAALHVVHILCLPLRSITQRKLINTAYSQVKSGVEMPWDEQAVWRTDLYLSGGVLGMGMLCLLAITSLPSVSNILTWKEFTFIQSGLGHVALTLTVMHTLVIGWNFAFSFKAYPFFMPPSYMLAVALPCAVLVCRCFLLLPCISARLTRIRRGWESTRKCPVQQHKRLQENRTIPQV